jgi:hypothetical protein
MLPKRNVNYRSSQNQKFWRWDNWQAYLVVIIIPVIGFPLYRFFMKQTQKNQEAEIAIQQQQQLIANQDPIKQQSVADSITTDKSVQSYAKELAFRLGTAFSDNGHWYNFLDPRGWTEDDTRVADIVIYQRKNYQLLVKLYNKCYSNSRSLSDDLFKYVDNDQLIRIKKYVNI